VLFSSFKMRACGPSLVTAKCPPASLFFRVICMAKAKIKVPSQRQLTRWHKLEEKRLKYGRMAKANEKLQEPLEKIFEAYVRAHGGEELKVELHGFELYIDKKNGKVSWKSKYIEKTSEEEAERLIKACPKEEYLVVEKVA